MMFRYYEALSVYQSSAIFILNERVANLGLSFCVNSNLLFINHNKISLITHVIVEIKMVQIHNKYEINKNNFVTTYHCPTINHLVVMKAPAMASFD